MNFLARTVVTKPQYIFNRFHIGVVSPTSEEIGDVRSTSDEIADVTSTSDDVTDISRYIRKTSRVIFKYAQTLQPRYYLQYDV